MKTLADWLDYQLSINPVEIDLGIEQVKKVAELLGIQQPNAKIIIVSGTNGKGSTVATLESLLVNLGISVGSYSSPHFINYNERIKINRQPLDDSNICRQFAKIEDAREKTQLTFFEFGTLAAVSAFVEAEVEVIILEVGLGGRLDACNAWSAEVAIVTSIAIDHVDWLGDDINQIGREKAGVFRANKLAIIGANITESVLQHAIDIKAKTCVVNQDLLITNNNDSWDLSSSDCKFINLNKPSLSGVFQLNNSACAIYAVQYLFPNRLTPNIINTSLADIKIIGRLQNISYNKQSFLLDVAHNPHASQALAEHLTGDQPKIAIFGIMQDKDIAEVIDIMSDSVSEWILFDLKVARAVSPVVLAETLIKAGAKVTIADNCEHAIKLSLTESNNYADHILVFGSFFTVAAVLQVVGVNNV